MSDSFSYEDASTRPSGAFSYEDAGTKSTSEKPKGPGAIRKAGDLAVGVVGGAIGATKALTDVAGAGNAASNFLDSANKDIDSLLSPQAQADKQEQSAIMKEAEGKGTYEGVKAGLKAFAVAPVQTTMSGLGSVIPVAAATLATGGGAIPAMAAGAATGAAMGAGTVKGAIYDDIKERSLAAGMTPEAAEAEATKAQSYGGGNTDQIALGAGLGMLDAATGVTPIVANMARKAVGREAVQALTTNTGHGILRRTATGAVEEIPLEAAQGGQEQLASNIAAQRAGFQAGTWDNVASNATLEGLASAGPGGLFGALNKGTVPPVVPPVVPPAEAPPPTTQLLGHDPMAGTHTVFPDGSIVLNSESSNGAKTVRDMKRATRLENAADPFFGDPAPVKPSEAMGLAPTPGPSLANAAILSVDSGLHQSATAEADPYSAPLSSLGQELAKTNQRLRQESDALGLDTEGLMGDAARMTDGKPHEDYLTAANDQLRRAMKAAKEIPYEGQRGDSADPAPGSETKGPDAQAGKAPAGDAGGPVRAGAVRPSVDRVGEHGQRAPGTDSGSLPGTVAPKANGNAETTTSAPAAPAAGLPAAGSAPVQADGVDKNGFIHGQGGTRVKVESHTKGSNALDPSADIGALTYTIRGGTPLDMVLSKEGKLIVKGEAMNEDGTSNGRAWVPPDQSTSNAVKSLLEKRAATAIGSTERKAIDAEISSVVQATIAPPQSGNVTALQPQGTTANVPQPAQPGTQASPAPSAQGAAPAVGDTSAPVGTAVATEPWKMTRKEYAQQGGDISYSSEGSGSHRGFVEAAVSRGETISPEVLKDYPWIAADQNIKPYADGLRNLSDNELRSEEKRATDALNKWANKTPAINKDGGEISINPQLHTVDSFEVSARFNAVNNEIERRKDNPNEAPTSGPVAPEAKAPKQNALQKRVQKAQQDRADYFTPGNIVKSYSGHDRVIGYTPPVKDGGNWSVRVQSVVKQGDKWVNDPKDNRERQHSTPPDAKELASGPVFRNPVQPQGATSEPQAQETVTPEPGSETPAAAADTVGRPAWSGAPIENLQQLAKQKRSSARQMRKNASVAQERGDSIQSAKWMDQAKDADKTERLIQEEIERRSNQQAETQRPQEPAAAAEPVGARSVHIAAGEAAYAKGDPRVLPSYFTKPGDKNSKDWFKGWDAAKAASGESQPAATANPKIKEAPDKKNEADAEPVAARTATEHAGLKIYPTKVKVGAAVVDMWGVQTPDNARREKNGERQIGGDPLSETLDGAKKNAEAEVRDAKSRAEREAESKAADDAAQAKKDANKGKSILQRRAVALLDKQHTYPPQAGLGQGTRREAMQSAVDQGRAIVERMVPDTAAKNRDRAAIDLVRARGYILGASNENIPVVKQGLEAQARMKANQYEKPEYRVYDSAKTDGGFYEITKTEFDYAKSLEGKPGEPSSAQTSPVTNPANEPTAEQIAAIGDITIEVPTENGTAKMTVNAAKALAHIDERMDALEMVQRCLG